MNDEPSDKDEVAILKLRIGELEDQVSGKAPGPRFRTVVESAPCGMIVSDAVGRIILVNALAEELFGYSHEEFLELSIRDIVPEDLRNSHVQDEQNYREDPSPRPMGAGRDLFAQRKDGSVFPSEISLTPLPTPGGEQQVLSTIVDITKRKQREEEQRRNESQIRYQAETLMTVHDAVFCLDQAGVIRDWNAGAENIFGIAASEAVGEAVGQICCQSGRCPISTRILPAVIRDGIADEVARIILRTGEEVVLQVKAVPARFNGNDGIVFCACDITNEKNLEAEILKVSEEEQRRIGQDIHDDLCSHLSGIGCLTEAMEQQMKADHHKEAEMLSSISEMVAKAGVKARAIAKGLVPSALETQGLAGALQELAERSCKLFGVNCVAVIRENEAFEGLDKNVCVQFYRIAQEAVTNAIRHSDASVIELGIGPSEGRLELQVKDDGKGMPKDMVSAGLGLLTMRRRAELIGADFDVHGSPGHGTTIQCSVAHLKNNE